MMQLKQGEQMKHLLLSTLVFGLMAFGHQAKAEQAQLTTELSTGFIDELNESIVIRMKNNSNRKWVIEQTKSCKSYPCDTSDNTIRTTVRPEVLENSSEGDKILKLNENFKIIYIAHGFEAGPKKEPEYILEYQQDGVVKTYKLSLNAEIEIKE